MTLDETGLVVWEPTPEQMGDNPVLIQVEDGRGGIAEQSFTIRVLAGGTNQSPEIVSTPRSINATVGLTYEYDLVAEDPEGDPLLWSLSTEVWGMSIDPIRGTLRWAPRGYQLGETNVVVGIFDSQGGFDMQSFTLTVRDVNLPPQISSTPPTRAQVNQAYGYAVRATDLEGDPLTFSLTTAPVGMDIDPLTGLILWSPTADQVGSQHSVTVRVEDAQGGAALQTYSIDVALAAVNGGPSIVSTPSTLTSAAASYTYQVIASDPEGDLPTFALAVAPAGMSIDSASGLVEWTPTFAQLGSQIVVVAVSDPSGNFAWQGFSLTVQLPNNPPQITSTPAAMVTAGNLYAYDVLVTDPDNDPLSLELVASPAGMSLDDFGRLRWSPLAGDIGTHLVEVLATDARGASDRQSFQLEVLADTQSPLINVLVDRNPINVGESVTILVDAVDNVGVETRALTIGGTAIPLDAIGRATVPMATLGSIEIVGTATDAAGNSANRTIVVSVIDPTDLDFPLVAIASPEENDVITAPTDVVGTVFDDNLDFYTLSAAPAGSDDFREFARGNATVTNDVLGTFDPSIFANDSYVLRLSATDLTGRTASVETIVGVTGALKLGNFTLSFNDLTIPVSGVPITVARTYDSLEANRGRELGYGWRLEFRHTDLRTDVPATGFESVGIYNAFRPGTRVYVTVPGGGRQSFTFQPRLASGFRGTYLGLYEPYFEPEPGVTSQLTVKPFELVLTDEGNFVSFSSSSVPYNPTNVTFGGGYQLTTEDGLAYAIDAATGNLETLSDTNANTLTFSDDGIFSSTGKEITFERDPQGRITSVIDPMGNAILYSYDQQGDLTAVTDREGNVTRFEYNEPTFNHYLTDVIDPLGRTGVRTEYDELGRMVKLIDANGEFVQLIHDPDNAVETIVDQLGNPTTYEYDARGNVVTEINAEGGITRRTYDTDNNTLSETVLLEDGTELTTNFTYDEHRNQLSSTDPLGNATNFTYQRFTFPSEVTSYTVRQARPPFSRQTASIDPLGNTTQNVWDDRGNLTSTTNSDGLHASFSYDPAGNPTQLANGSHAINIQYDASGKATQLEDAAGTIRTFTHDDNGKQLSETTVFTTLSGPSVVVTETEYDDEGRVTRTIVRQDGVVLSESSTTYDPIGKAVATTDALSRVTRFVYDDRGVLTETILPDDTPNDMADNLRTRMEYDAAGQVVAKIDAAGRITRFEYDKVGQQTKVIQPDDTPSDGSDNPFTQTVYDLAGRVVAQIDQRGNAIHFEYDAVGNRTTTIFPDETPDDISDNPRIVDVYDVGGRWTTSTDPVGRVTQFDYSAEGMLVATLHADGSRTTSGFDDQRRVTLGTDENGNPTRYEYDDLDRLTAVIQQVDLRDLRTEYAYDERGNLTLQRDALGRETRFEYDGLGRRTKTILPDGTPGDLSDNLYSTTAYDAVGRIESTTDFNGDTIRFEYDVLDRLITKDYPTGPDVEFTYTPTGHRSTATDGRGVTRWEYDKLDRLKRRIDPDGAEIAYTYDLAGNRVSVSTKIPGHDPRMTTYTYDAQNRMLTTTDPEGGITSYVYNAASELVHTAFPNGTYEIREYNDVGRLLAVESFGPDDALLAGFHYHLDAVGNRTRMTEQAPGGWRVVDYVHDELYRLTSETRYDDVADPLDISGETADQTIGYQYDDVGNRLLREDSVGGTTASLYDTMDRLLEETLTELSADVVRATYTYDQNGNSVTKSASRNGAEADEIFYDWDYENRLIATDIDGDGTADVTNQYDVDGIRVTQTVAGEETRYLIDTVQPFAQVVEEYIPGGAIKVSYIHARDLISQNRAGVKTFYHVDGLGSTRALTNAAGLVTDRYSYDAFGRTIDQIGSTNNVYLFAGEQRDPNLGLDYLRARYLATSTGRFFGRDTWPGELRIPSTLHKYSYATNNPVTFVDPSGLMNLSELNFVTLIRRAWDAIGSTTRFKTQVETAKGVEDFVFLSTLAIMTAAARVAPDSRVGLRVEIKKFSNFGQLKRADLRFYHYPAEVRQLALDFKDGKRFRFSINFSHLDQSEFQFGVNFNIHTVLLGPLEVLKLDLAPRIALTPLPQYRFSLDSTILTYIKFVTRIWEYPTDGDSGTAE